MRATSNRVKLKLLNLPVIENLDDFSRITHLTKTTIWRLSNFSDKYYLEYKIPKKSGKKRVIAQPSMALKALQSWVLRNILDKLSSSTSSMGFEKGKTILDNAKPHIGASIILNLDIDNFFPSIKANKVYSVFSAIGYNSLISSILTNICTYKNALPQGGPCSPKLANLICISLDNRIQGYVGKKGIIYTRYADDLTFSGLTPYKVIKIIALVEKILNEEGFNLNEGKTRVAGLARAKCVTGLIVNEKDAGVGERCYHKVRSKIFHLVLAKEANNLELLSQVRGWLAFLKSVDTRRFDKAMRYIEKLKINKAYQRRLIQKL